MIAKDEVHNPPESENSTNYDIFRDCLSDIIIARLAPVSINTSKRKKQRTTKAGRKPQARSTLTTSPDDPSPPNDTNVTTADDLSDFTAYLTSLIFPSLPSALRELDYAFTKNDPEISAAYSPPLPASTISTVAGLLEPGLIDSLTAYGLLSSAEEGEVERTFLEPLLTSYTTAATAPPPSIADILPYARPGTACEICGRDWIPLTYHHLIPRSTHAKVLKRGWHEEWRLNSVAWLCRACHSFVHRLESNEVLARSFYSVELLLERSEVEGFARWVGGVRWKAR